MDESKHRLNNEIKPDGDWMIVELLGHKKIAGFVSEVEKWGQVLMRIDIPTRVIDGILQFTTQFYGTHALYCATPIKKSDAISLSRKFRPAPFDIYDLPKEDDISLDTLSENHVIVAGGKSNGIDDLPF